MTYEEQRAALVAAHDDGAQDALREALNRENVPVECMAYCYGGSAVPDVPEILADLAESGWRLTRAER